MTNEEGKRREGSKWKPVDSVELKALIGLFIHLGAQKLNLLKVSKIWYGAFVASMAGCTMSMKRFIEQSTALRFDDKTTCSNQRDKDIFTPVQDLFDEVNKQLQTNYIPSNA